MGHVERVETMSERRHKIVQIIVVPPTDDGYPASLFALRDDGGIFQLDVSDQTWHLVMPVPDHDIPFPTSLKRT